MDTSIIEAIRDVREAGAFYGLAGVTLGVVAILFIIIGMTNIYCRSLNTVYIVLIPSACLLCMFKFFTLGELFLYFGLSINILGYGISILPLARSTCEMDPGPPFFSPCQIPRFQNWAHQIMSGGGGWEKIWTRNAVVNISITVIALLVCVYFGFVAARGTVWWLCCGGCQQERKQKDWKVNADYWSEDAKCRRCQDLELAELSEGRRRPGYGVRW